MQGGRYMGNPLQDNGINQLLRDPLIDSSATTWNEAPWRHVRRSLASVAREEEIAERERPEMRGGLSSTTTQPSEVHRASQPGDRSTNIPAAVRTQRTDAAECTKRNVWIEEPGRTRLGVASDAVIATRAVDRPDGIQHAATVYRAQAKAVPTILAHSNVRRDGGDAGGEQQIALVDELAPR